MGFGFPAAIGAQLRAPGQAGLGDRRRRRLPDDAVRAGHRRVHKLPVKVLIINNNYLGMVRQWQELFFDNRLCGVDLEGNPDFVKLAEAYGIKGFRITRAGDVDKRAEEGHRVQRRPVRGRGRGREGGQRLPDDPRRRPARDMIIERPKTRWRSRSGSRP